MTPAPIDIPHEASFLLVAGGLGGHGTGPAVPVGMLAGIAAALVVNHRARDWLMRLRLRPWPKSGCIPMVIEE